MHNMCCADGLSALEDAAIGVFGFIGRSGRPVSCAVTPYLDRGQPVVTSTLALVGKIGAVLRDERVALLAGGVEARGQATVAVEDDGEWFDRAIRAQELRKYPPARFLLRLPGHRRLLWWYVGRAVVRLPADGLRPVPGPDRVTITGIDHDGLISVVPVTGDVRLDADEIPVPIGLPDGPACLLVHEESAGMSDLRQLRLEGQLISGRLSVQRRSGTLAATHRGPLAQLRDLAALGRAATANRTRIESWKTRLGPAGPDLTRFLNCADRSLAPLMLAEGTPLLGLLALSWPGLAPGRCLHLLGQLLRAAGDKRPLAADRDPHAFQRIK